MSKFYKITIKHRVEYESELLIEAPSAKEAMRTVVNNFDAKQFPYSEISKTKPSISSVDEVE